jgi:hypothetical protein
VFRKTVEAMAGYVPGEQPRDRRYIKLNTNENPYPPSPQVIDALRDAVGENLRLYPRPMADELRERAARLFRLQPENVLVGNGSDELLAILMRAVIDPGDAVAYPVPTYSLYDTLVTLHSGEAIHVPFAPDFSLPDELADVDARMIIVCNPNSPSGTWLAPQALGHRPGAGGAQCDHPAREGEGLLQRESPFDRRRRRRATRSALDGSERTTYQTHPRCIDAPADGAGFRRAAVARELRAGAPPGRGSRSALRGPEASRRARALFPHAGFTRCAAHHGRYR